jgi:hypothetical protein
MIAVPTCSGLAVRSAIVGKNKELSDAKDNAANAKKL